METQITNNDLYQAHLDSKWVRLIAEFESFLEFYYKGFETHLHNVDALNIGKGVDDVTHEARLIFTNISEVLWDGWPERRNVPDPIHYPSINSRYRVRREGKKEASAHK